MTSNLTGHEMPVQGFNGVRKSRFSIGGAEKPSYIEGEQKEAWVVRSKAVFRIFQEYEL